MKTLIVVEKVKYVASRAKEGSLLWAGMTTIWNKCITTSEPWMMYFHGKLTLDLGNELDLEE